MKEYPDNNDHAPKTGERDRKTSILLQSLKYLQNGLEMLPIEAIRRNPARLDEYFPSIEENDLKMVKQPVQELLTTSQDFLQRLISSVNAAPPLLPFTVDVSNKESQDARFFFPTLDIQGYGFLREKINRGERSGFSSSLSSGSPGQEERIHMAHTNYKNAPLGDEKEREEFDISTTIESDRYVPMFKYVFVIKKDNTVEVSLHLPSLVSSQPKPEGWSAAAFLLRRTTGSLQHLTNQIPIPQR